MTGGEIEQPRLRRQVGPTTQPGIEQIGPTTDAGLKQQRRQGKVVSEMRFITAPQIGEVFLLRNIGLGDHNAIGSHLIEQQPQHPNQLMGLRQVNA